MYCTDYFYIFLMDKDLGAAKFGTTHVEANTAALENSNK